ncbi:hypothetical protein MP638_006735 [Amoeboaphelidium occidentale]|nr:hypothetical protein MP638_006735 [Amoeboaphelidium occidentale]
MEADVDLMVVDEDVMDIDNDVGVLESTEKNSLWDLFTKYLNNNYSDVDIFTDILVVPLHEGGTVPLLPYDIEDLAINEDVTNGTETYSIKVGVNTGLCLENRELAGVKAALEEISQRVSIVRFWATRFINYVALYYLENNLGIPNLSRSADGMLRKCFTIVASDGIIQNSKDSKKAINGRFLAALYRGFAEHSGLNSDNISSLKGFSQLLAGVSRQYEANAKTHVKMNFPKKLKRWIMWKLECILPAVFKANTRSGYAADYIISCVKYVQKILKTEPKFPEKLHKSIKKATKFDHALFFKSLAAVSRVTNDALFLLGPLSLDSKKMKIHFCDYLGVMHQIQKDFYNNFQSNAASRKEERRTGKGLRLFNLFPMTKARCGNVLYSTDGYYELLKYAKNQNNLFQEEDFPVSLAKFKAEGVKEYWFKRCINVQYFESLGSYRKFGFSFSQMVKFGFSFYSDGVTLCPTMIRPKTFTLTDDYGFVDESRTKFLKHDLNDVEVVGVDPGRKDLFYSVLGDKKDVASLSVQQWCWLRGDYHFRNKQKKWLKERNEVQQADKSILTSKVPTVDGFIDFARSCVARFNVAFDFYGAVRWRKLKWNLYIRRQKANKQKKWLKERNEVQQADKSMLTSNVPTVDSFIDFARSCVARFNVAFDFYGAVRWRKLKWNLYIRRQKAYDFACKKLKFGKKLKNIVVAYGDGSFSGSSRGYAPVPTKQLYIQMKIRMKQRIVKVDEFRTSKLCYHCEGEFEQQREWRLKYCPNCKVWWHRDINASLNIRKLYLHQNQHNGARPQAFSRSIRKNDPEETAQKNSDFMGGFAPMTVETPSVSAYKAAQDGQLNVLRTLLPENPNLIRSKDEDGRTLLHHAVKHSSVVELLLEQDRCDVEAKDEAGWTPLHIAASTNQEMTVKLLIAKDADVNATNDSGVTPLCYACSKGYKNIVTILLDNGADALLRDKFGRSVFHRAVLKGQLSILKLLFEKVKSASVNQPDADNNTLLHLAVEEENGEIVKFLLLEKHADATYKNKEGKSVSEVASKTFLPYFQRLLENAI